MSLYECASWNWYMENMTGFALDAGITSDAFRALGLRGPKRRMFLRAMREIHREWTAMRTREMRSAGG